MEQTPDFNLRSPVCGTRKEYEKEMELEIPLTNGLPLGLATLFYY